MTTAELIILDHTVALLSVAAWCAAGATAATQRTRLALGLLAVAVVTVARVSTVGPLAARGWWFVQEKVLLFLPMLIATGLTAVLVAGPRLLAGWRSEAAADGRRASRDRLPAGAVVPPLTAGYAALAGLAVTVAAGYPLTWSTALTATSVVGMGALLTTRVVAAQAGTTNHNPPGPPAISRRRFVGLAGGLFVASTGVTGIGLLFRTPEPIGGGPSGPGPALSVADLRGAGAPAPGGMRRRYALTAQTATVGLPSGHQVQALAYSGASPRRSTAGTTGRPLFDGVPGL